MLRSYIRQRDTRIRDAAAHVQRMQKALIQMNVQLHKVISDITGVSGMRIIRAILGGERDPQVLAAMRDHRIKSSPERIAQSLQGDYRPEHLFALEQCLSLYDTYRTMIADCDQRIEQCLGGFDAQVDPACSPLGQLSLITEAEEQPWLLRSRFVVGRRSVHQEA